jgi:hypothetical protein
MSDLLQPEELTLKIELVTVAILKEITATLDPLPLIDDTTIAGLRNDYPNLRFSLCYDTEMGFRDAYTECDGYDIHLVSHSTSGCSGLTDQLDNCTGLVIALHDE